ncbi:protein MCM10 homolog isoform X2 [Mytilus trossulus]|uniref:protein MCM10 homolog isoform X2 n=1 Tax=Mytilus trossulus TaxID=6551 RepID=UPI003006AE45
MDECDLDALTALLEDSDLEEEPVEANNANSQDDNDDGCDIDEITAFLEQSDSEDDTEVKTDIGTKVTQQSNKDITSFLEQCDSKEKSDVKSDKYSGTETKQFDDNEKNDRSSKDTVSAKLCNESKQKTQDKLEITKGTEDQGHESDDGGQDCGNDEDQDCETDDEEQDVLEKSVEVDNIQAELLEMQRKMQELQNRLAKTKSTTPKDSQKNRTSKYKSPSAKQDTRRSDCDKETISFKHKSPSAKQDTRLSECGKKLTSSKHKSPSAKQDTRMSECGKETISSKHNSPSTKQVAKKLDDSKHKTLHGIKDVGSNGKKMKIEKDDGMDLKSLRERESLSRDHSLKPARKISSGEIADKMNMKKKLKSAASDLNHSKSAVTSNKPELKASRPNDSESKGATSKNTGSDKQIEKSMVPSGILISPTSSAKPRLTLSEDNENPFFGPSESTSEECIEDKKHESKSEECLMDRKTLEKSLFGDDDSDWEPMEEDDKVKLSDEGQELRKMIKDHGKVRQSNVTSEEVEAMRKKAQKTTWKPKGLPTNSSTSPTGNQKSTKENDDPSLLDPFSGIRIVNPKISSLEMKSRMRDRKLVKISKIDRRVSEHDNWVTIGVIVSKTDPRQSATGKTYCIWKLSDLQDCDKSISFFLFGEVYKQHWKNEVTAVVGILNPNLMDKAEKAQNDMAFTVNHQAQIMLMGYSKDFGRCAAMSGKGKNTGKHCSNFINKQQGEFCTFHVQRAYSHTCSQRTELQGSYSGMTPTNHKYKPQDKKDGFFFYQGQTFTTGKNQSNKNNKHKITVDKLKHQQAVKGQGKVTTMSLHAIDPEDIKKLKKLDNVKEEENPLLDMLTVPSPGSMNFVKHLMTKDKKPQVNPEFGKPIIESITAKDLLKQHKQMMKQKRQGGITSDPLKCTPTLGKGFTPGKDVCLEFSSQKSDFARRKAIAKVQAKGGITKENPNAVKKKKSPDAHKKIRKRIHESHDMDNNEPTEERPRKRSKLLGNIDENSAEFKELMKARSKHTGAIAEVEAEMEDRYFMVQEKKEKLEDKMASTMEIKTVVFTCKQCKYTAHSAKDECKKQNHNIVKIQTMKRFFKCKKCNHRTSSIEKIPTQSCRNCGDDNFERVSMLQERKGPKLPHEELCIRGDEIKFLGSMDEKVYL